MANGTNANLVPDDWKEKLFRKLEEIVAVLTSIEQDQRKILEAIRECCFGTRERITSKIDEILSRSEESDRELINRLDRISDTVNNIFLSFTIPPPTELYRMLTTIVNEFEMYTRRTQTDTRRRMAWEMQILEILYKIARRAGLDEYAEIIRRITSNAAMAIRSSFDKTSWELINRMERIQELLITSAALQRAGLETLSRFTYRQAIRELGQFILNLPRQIVSGLESRFGTRFGLLRRISELLGNIYDLFRLPVELVIMGLLMPLLLILLRFLVPILTTILPVFGEFVQWMAQGGLAQMIVAAVGTVGMALITTLFGTTGPLFIFLATITTLAVVVGVIIVAFRMLRERIGNLAGAIVTFVAVLLGAVVAIRSYTVIVSALTTLTQMFNIALTSATISLLALAASLGLFALVVGGIVALVMGITSIQPRTPDYTNLQLPSLQMGGYVPAEGIYYLHAGEYVVPAGRSVPTSNTFHITVNVNAEVSSDIDIDRLGSEIAERIVNEIRMRIKEV